MHRKQWIKWVLAGLFGVLLLLIAGDSARLVWYPLSGTSSLPGYTLNRILRDGRIIIATRESPSLYHENAEGTTGLERDKALAFAAAFGLQAEFQVHETRHDVINAVMQGQAHIGAGGLLRSEALTDRVYFAAGYLPATLQVVCHRRVRRPRQVADLARVDLRIVAGLGYENVLEQERATHPDIDWSSEYGVAVETMIERVAAREVECTLADSNTIRVSQRFFPELRVAFDIGETSEFCWALPKHARRLHEAYANWLDGFTASGELERLQERYFDHYDKFDYVEIRTFHRRIASELPKYRQYFEETATAIGVPWTLLAAQSYQESHWNPQARSPTGVLGMMMLTRPTAEAMGLVGRTSAEGSIRSGGRYLKKILGQISLNVPDDERIWYALAAYNVGIGHLNDAQTLAHELGYNPYRWSDLKEVLPLLSRKEHYSRLKFGYARGIEPVIYIQRIRQYKDILDYLFKPHLHKLEPDDVVFPLIAPDME